MKDDHSNRMTRLELEFGPGKGHLMEPMVLMDDEGHLYGIRLLRVLILF